MELVKLIMSLLIEWDIGIDRMMLGSLQTILHTQRLTGGEIVRDGAHSSAARVGEHWDQPYA